MNILAKFLLVIFLLVAEYGVSAEIKKVENQQPGIYGCWKIQSIVFRGRTIGFKKAKKIGLLSANENSMDENTVCYYGSGQANFKMGWGDSLKRTWTIENNHLIIKHLDGKLGNDYLFRIEKDKLFTKFNERYWLVWIKIPINGV
jgi:hypothetical protein